jgi:hypothetical protein
MRPTLPFVLLLLAACAATVTDRPADEPRIGVIESAAVVSLASSPSATAGGTTPQGPTMAYRLKMEDGTTQSIVQAGERLELGERVEIMQDGRLMRR